MHVPGYATRSTTPPLYYHRPDGVAPSYYAAPKVETAVEQQQQQQQHSSLTAPPLVSVPCPRPSYTTSAPLRASVSLVPPPPSPRSSGSYVLPSVANPFISPPNAASSAAAPNTFSVGRTWQSANSASMMRMGVDASSRWSTSHVQQPLLQQSFTNNNEAAKIASLQAEEASLASEEAALRATLADLRLSQRHLEEEQLQLSHGWSMLLEREERYYTEPRLDLSEDIAAREEQCRVLGEACAQQQQRAAELEEYVHTMDHVLHQQQRVQADVQQLREGFSNINKRRRRCVVVAERFFDVEVKRATAAQRAIRLLAAQLKEMSMSGPLAMLQAHDAPPTSSRRSTRGVKFGLDQPSLVLDVGLSEDVAGLTASQDDEGPSTHALQADASLCIGLGENEEDEMAIGGVSVAYSLNSNCRDGWKRHKVEPPVRAISA